MLLLNGGHYTELKETLGAGLPVIFAAFGLSLLLVVLAALPPSALPVGTFSELLAPRRRQVALFGISVSLSAALSIAIVFWAL
jgi:hypothetical protein